jgi:hypothetical protein
MENRKKQNTRSKEKRPKRGNICGGKKNVKEKQKLNLKEN